MRRFIVGLLILVSALALVGASTSLWTRRHVVNTDVFVAGSQKVINDPAVQARLESQVVTSVMANPDVQQAINDVVASLPPRLQTFRPTIENGAQNLLATGVHTILTSPAFSAVTTAALRSAQTQLINGQSVQFTIGQAKALVPPGAQTGLAGQVLALIPDNLGITVLTKQQAPQVYSAIDTLKVLWLWLGLAALAALAGALVISHRRKKTLRAWSVTTGVLGLVLVLTFAIARGPLLSNVKPVNVDAVDAIYGGVTGSMRSWTLWLVLIMFGITVITLLWGRIGIIPAVRRGYHAVRAQAARYREQHAAVQAAPGTDGTPAPALSWPRRFAAGTGAFFDSLNLPERLRALAEFLRRNLRVARWAGVGVGALVLLFWPSPTLSVLIWVAAFVALYLGLIELVLAIAARGSEETPAAVATTGNGSAVHPLTPAPVEPAPRAAEPKPVAPAPVAPGATPEFVSALGTRLEVLMRLGDARTAGLLTDDEFAHEKAQLLA
ncbi:MAG TPA: hypothetical protein VJ870_14945 [Amycolatopsis sp.]|nr:hypothetical protein [Amycolatopsis sp.]